MKASTLFPSRYLKAADLEDRQLRVTIKNMELEQIATGEDKKPVLYFKEGKKGLCLNKTNTNTIVKSYGDEINGWMNKPIILFSAIVDFRGESVEAIRVRIPKDKIETSPKRMTKQTENPAPEEEATDDIMDTF